MCAAAHTGGCAAGASGVDASSHPTGALEWTISAECHARDAREAATQSFQPLIDVRGCNGAVSKDQSRLRPRGIVARQTVEPDIRFLRERSVAARWMPFTQGIGSSHSANVVVSVARMRSWRAAYSRVLRTCRARSPFSMRLARAACAGHWQYQPPCLWLYLGL
jgi:hypothetical protein